MFNKPKTLDQAYEAFIADFRRITETAQREAEVVNTRMSEREATFNRQQGEDNDRLHDHKAVVDKGQRIIAKFDEIFAD